MKRARGLRLRLEHMLQGIARIEHLTAGKTVEEYLADEGLRENDRAQHRTYSEAARSVPNEVRTRYFAVPWLRIVGIGNVIRHDDDEIDDRVMVGYGDREAPTAQGGGGAHLARHRGD